MIIKGKPYEIAEENNLNFSYRYHNGNMNGAVSFWRDESDEPTTFAVIAESGEGETWEQTLELLVGEWPIPTPAPAAAKGEGDERQTSGHRRS